MVVLDAEDHDAAIGVGEAGDLLGDLIAHHPTIARSLPAGRALEQRLAVVVLPLVSGNQLAQLRLGKRHGPSHSVTHPGVRTPKVKSIGGGRATPTGFEPVLPA